MGWETRGGCGRYYTRSRREGGRVVREYVGTGFLAEQAAWLDGRQRESDRQDRAAWRATRDEYEATAALVAEVDGLAEALARAALLASGYRQHHRGDWRKRRGDQG